LAGLRQRTLPGGGGGGSQGTAMQQTLLTCGTAAPSTAGCCSCCCCCCYYGFAGAAHRTAKAQAITRELSRLTKRPRQLPMSAPPGTAEQSAEHEGLPGESSSPRDDSTLLGGCNQHRARIVCATIPAGRWYNAPRRTPEQTTQPQVGMEHPSMWRSSPIIIARHTS
jgi:hypothetical protein